MVETVFYPVEMVETVETFLLIRVTCMEHPHFWWRNKISMTLTCGHSMPLHFSWCEFSLPAFWRCWLPQYMHFAYTLLLTRISTKCCQTVDWIFRSSALIHGDCCLKFSFWLYTSWDENWFNVAMIYNFIFRERVMVKPQNVSLNWLSRTIPIFWKGMKKPLNN